MSMIDKLSFGLGIGNLIEENCVELDFQATKFIDETR